MIRRQLAASADPQIVIRDTALPAQINPSGNTGAGANTSRPRLTDTKAAGYTPQRHLVGGDGWRPLG